MPITGSTITGTTVVVEEIITTITIPNRIITTDVRTEVVGDIYLPKIMKEKNYHLGDIIGITQPLKGGN